MSVIGKIITRAIANRIQAEAESRGWLADNQGGFRPGRRTEDNALVLLRALERRRQDGNGYVFFLDVKKAYDTVWRKGLLFKLHALGIRGSMYRLLENLYTGTTSTVVGGAGVESREFVIEEGVRQGDPLSCVLFNLFFNDIMEAINGANCRGMRVGDVKQVKGLMFADDVVGLATSKKGLSNLMDAVGEHSRKWRWAPNVAKSKVMTVMAKEPTKRARFDDRLPSWKLRGKSVAGCTEYKYLGIVVQEDLNWEKHIRRIRDKARGRAGQWWTWLGKHRLRRDRKLNLYSMLVRPVMEYASAVWDADSKQEALLEAVQNECLRQTMPCDKSVPVAFLRAELGMASLAARRKKLLLRYWFQMHSQADKSRLAYKAFTWDLKCRSCRSCSRCLKGKNCVKSVRCDECKCRRRLRRTLAQDEFKEYKMDQKGYESMLSPLSPSSVSHSGGDGEEKEQMSMHEVRSMFMKELDESFSGVCLEEAMVACKKLHHPVTNGIPLVVAALRYKEKWGIEEWLAGSSVGGLLKFRAHAGRLLTGRRWVVDQEGRSVQVEDPCPMCEDQGKWAEAQKHFLVRCPKLKEERESLLATGPLGRHFSTANEEELYFVLLWDSFAQQRMEGRRFEGRNAYEIQEAIEKYLLRCWAIRREALEKAEARRRVESEPEAQESPVVQVVSSSRHSGDVPEHRETGFRGEQLPSRQDARRASGVGQSAQSASSQSTSTPFILGAPTPLDVFCAPDPIVSPGIAAHGLNGPSIN